jgi:GntR family transcriptional regulator
VSRRFECNNLQSFRTTCNSTAVIPFRVQFENGISIFEQVVYAAKKAMIAGQLRPGDSFPSVRSLSKELKINPNTAHKIVTHLISEGLLETRPGIGTVVAIPPNSTSKERTQLLVREVEALVLEAKRLGIMQEDLVTAVGTQWDKLSRKDAPSKLQPTYGGSKPR